MYVYINTDNIYHFIFQMFLNLLLNSKTDFIIIKQTCYNSVSYLRKISSVLNCMTFWNVYLV